MNLDLKQLGPFFRGLSSNLKDAAIRGAMKGAKEALPILQRSGDTAPPASDRGSVGAFDTGAYRRAWRVMRRPAGVLLYNAMPYADVINKGRRKGKKPPPRKVIEAWARRRLKLSPREAERAAYLIARAIGKRGLKARLVEDRSEKRVTKVVAKRAREAVSQMLRTGRPR